MDVLGRHFIGKEHNSAQTIPVPEGCDIIEIVAADCQCYYAINEPMADSLRNMAISYGCVTFSALPEDETLSVLRKGDGTVHIGFFQIEQEGDR